MNPKFAEITLNIYIFVMNIFCTDPARNFGMIDITHGLVSVYYIMIVRVKSDGSPAKFFYERIANFLSIWI